MIINKTEVCSENKILATARLLGEYFYPNSGSHPPDWVLVPAIRELAKSKPKASPEDLFERFVAESNGKYRKYLSQYVAALSTGELAAAEHDAFGVFTGARKFSFAKLSAMVSFFASRPICKQKLNHLLFYSDFTNYYVYNHSISGARYVRRPNAPVMQGFGSMLTTLSFTGVVRTENAFGRGIGTGTIVTAEKVKLDDLSLLEVITMHGVHEEFDSMTSADIREYTTKESVYRFTRQDDFIPYTYSRLLTRLA